MVRARAIPLVILALAAFSLAECNQKTAAPSSSPAAAVSDTPAPPGGSPTAKLRGEAGRLLTFEAPLLGGGEINGVELAGKDLAIWFWAPW